MDRASKINAAGGFLRAMGERTRAGAQGADTGHQPLPVGQTLIVLAKSAPFGSNGVGIDEVAADLEISRRVALETLNNLADLDLVELDSSHGKDRVVLTELGSVVAEKQRAERDDC